MTTTIRAIYADGVLRPVRPLTIQDGTAVEVTIHQQLARAVPGDDELIKRIQAVKTLDELWATREGLSTEDGDYEIDHWLAESRALSGKLPRT